MIRTLLLLPFLAYGSAVNALDLNLPANALQTVDRDVALSSYEVPLGGIVNGELPTKVVEGRVRTQAWRVGNTDLTTLQILAPLRAQLIEKGFTVLVDCASDACGGFDFRFATEVLPAPNMYVDIRDYRFFAVVFGPPETLNEVATLLVSRSETAAFVQFIQVSGNSAMINPEPAETPEISRKYEPGPAGNLAARLMKEGHVILPDLSFETGSSQLSAGNFRSLDALAAHLVKHPEIRIALVGHTDSQGPLSRNIVLSKRRAQSVAERLVSTYAIPRSQMQAEGMGYLAPVASNL
ncbi:MAG: OmpA family protein, partial [Roseibium sp.]